MVNDVIMVSKARSVSLCSSNVMAGNPELEEMNVMVAIVVFHANQVISF